MQIKESSTGRTRRRVVTVGLGVGAALASTVAFAAWTTNSEGDVPGATARAAHPSITYATVDGALYPGDCNDVILNVYNSNPHPVEVAYVDNQGFTAVSDTASSESGHANRLEDFLYQANVHDSITGKRIGANASRTLTIPDAVCLRGGADDARMSQTFKAKYFVAYNLLPGTEADDTAGSNAR